MANQNSNSKQKGTILLIVGLIALIVGGYLYFSGNSEAINQANQNIATHATNAEEAARQISANNRSEIGGNSLSLFLMGFGSVLTLFSIVLLASAAKQSKQ